LLIDTVVCLTLAKWETVSGRFGGYLKDLRHILERQGDAIKPMYEGLDDRTMGIIATVQEYSMAQIVPVVFWSGFELLWMLIIPLSIFARKFILPLLPKSLQNKIQGFSFSQIKTFTNIAKRRA
jgi:hypothetical protein